MTVTRLQLVGAFDKEVKARYTQFNNKEFYPGIIRPIAGKDLRILVEKHCSCPYPVGRGIAETEYRYDRTSADVRLAQRDLSVIRLMKRGSAAFRQLHRNASAEPGDLIITSSHTPLSFTVRPDAGGIAEMIFMVVPTTDLCCGKGEHKISLTRLDGSNSHARIAATLLQTLMDENSAIHMSSAARLTSALLEEIRALVRINHGFEETATPAERRFRQVVSYIHLNFSDPDLSLERVAEANSVSARYVSLLFSRQPTSFAKFMWSYRLKRIKQWLQDEAMSSFSISELALRAGFKSAAHLSQMFRRELACSPKEFRRSCAGTASANQADITGGTG